MLKYPYLLCCFVAMLSSILIPHPPKSILFVCLGNICRSPSAEAVMRAKGEQAGFALSFDSAGTANYHTGEAPDSRAIKVGKSKGYDLSALQARQVTTNDFYEFDLIFAMDKHNLANLQKLMPQDALAKLQLFDPQGREVADPYYGDERDFEQMFTHIEKVADHWLTTWQDNS